MRTVLWSVVFVDHNVVFQVSLVLSLVCAIRTVEWEVAFVSSDVFSQDRSENDQNKITVMQVAAPI